MTNEAWITDLARSAKLKRAVSEEEIRKVEAEQKFRFPKEYCELLLFSDGLYGPIGRNYLQIYSLQDALETNEKFKEFTEGLFIFGSDGGGEAYAFDTRNGWKIMMATFVSMGREDAVEIADTLPQFVQRLSSGPRC